MTTILPAQRGCFVNKSWEVLPPPFFSGTEHVDGRRSMHHQPNMQLEKIGTNNPTPSLSQSEATERLAKTGQTEQGLQFFPRSSLEGLDMSTCPCSIQGVSGEIPKPRVFLLQAEHISPNAQNHSLSLVHLHVHAQQCRQ